MAGTPHPQDTPPELDLIEVLKVLALTQIAADEGANRIDRQACRQTAMQMLGIAYVGRRP